MALLSLDLGTATGWGIRSGGTTVSGVWSFKSGRYEGGGMRYLRFRRQLDELHDAAPIQEVVFEEVRNHMGTDAAHVYGGLLGVLTAWCEDNGVAYEGVPVGTIKKYATGKGNASKHQMIDAVRAWGYEPQDDNEADALALLHYRAAQHGDVDHSAEEILG